METLVSHVDVITLAVLIAVVAWKTVSALDVLSRAVSEGNSRSSDQHEKLIYIFDKHSKEIEIRLERMETKLGEHISHELHTKGKH